MLMFLNHTASAPRQIINLIDKRDSPARELRSKNCFIQNRPRTDLGRNTIRLRGPSIWNVIPPEMKVLKSLDDFKRKLKTFGKKLSLIQVDKGQAATASIDPSYQHF